MSKLTDPTNLLQLLPPSISGVDNVKNAAAAIDPQLQSVAYQVPLLFLWLRLLKTAGIQPPAVQAPFDELLAEVDLEPLDTKVLEQLAKQFHVDFREAAENDRQLAGLIVHSIEWHRIKGTPASIQKALELCGFHGIKIEEDGTGELWATYQLGFSSAKSIDDIKRIVLVCNEMQPARCKLWRVYTKEFDFRDAIWSDPDHGGWSNSYWSDVSGIKETGIPGRDDDHDLVISLGINNSYQAEKYFESNDAAGVAQTDGYGMQGLYRDAPRWSDCEWGEPFINNNQFIVGELSLFLLGRGKPFADLPKWAMTIISISRSMGVWSDDDEGWSDINSVWSISKARLWDATSWSDIAWSEGPIAETKYIDEYFIDNRQINTLMLSHDVGTGIEMITYYLMRDGQETINTEGYTFHSFNYAAQAWNGGYQKVYAERYWSEDEWSGEPIVQTEIFVPRPNIGIANNVVREIQTEQLGHRVHYGYFGNLANHIASADKRMRPAREDWLASASYTLEADEEIKIQFDSTYSEDMWSRGFLKKAHVWSGTEYSDDSWSSYVHEPEAYKHREPFEMINRYVVAYQAEGGRINVVMHSAQLGAYAAFVESVDDAIYDSRLELMATMSYVIGAKTRPQHSSVYSDDKFSDGFVRRSRVYGGSGYAEFEWSDYPLIAAVYDEREDSRVCVTGAHANMIEQPDIKPGFLTGSSNFTAVSRPLHPTHWWGEKGQRRWNDYHGYFAISSETASN